MDQGPTDDKDNELTERITTLLPLWLRKWVEKKANDNMTSLSATIRRMLADSYQRETSQ